MDTKPTLSKFHKGLLSLCAFVAAASTARLLLALVLENRAAISALAFIPALLLSWYVEGLLKKL